MTHTRKLRWLSAVLALFLSACVGGTDEIGNGHKPIGTSNSLQGRVVAQADAEGTEQEIANVQVSAAGQVTTTDTYGFWQLELPADATAAVTIDYFRSDYAPYTYHYPVAITQSAFVQVSLMPVQIMQKVTVADGAVISSNLGEDQMQLAIILPPNFIDIEGDTLDVSVSIVRPDKKEEYKRFPGDFIGIDSGIPEGRDLLRTFGTVNVSFSQNGVPLDDVKLNAPAVMQMRLDTTSATELSVGSMIATWWLNTNSAAWVREGVAQVVEINGAKYAEWQVNHFTWWNVDQPLDSHGCIAVEFSNISTQPIESLSGTLLELKGYDYAGWSQPLPLSATGTVVLTGWRDHDVRISIRYPGAPQSNLSMPFAPLDDTEGNIANKTFRVPATFGSGFWKLGPNGSTLDPKQHCKVITREYSLKQGVIEGFVYGPDGKSVGGVTIYISEIGISTTTDPAGHYTFTHVPWSNDGSIQLTVTGRSTLQYTVSSEPIVRNAAHNRVDLQLEAHEIAPRIVAVQLSATEAAVQSTVYFDISAEDNTGDLQWTVATQIGTVSLDSPQELAIDGSLRFRSTLHGAWTGPTASLNAIIRFSASDARDATASYATQVSWSNRAPILQLVGPSSIMANADAQYYAVALDPEQQPAQYQWFINNVLQSETASSLTRSFSPEGLYRIRVVANDGTNSVARELVTLVGSPISSDGVWASIPSGCFGMGDTFSEGYSYERPVHTACVTAFEMNTHKVTNNEYQVCVNAGGCITPWDSSSYTRPSYYGDAAYANFPVVNVNWAQSQAYCTWVGGKLPTEAEWEYAARGGLTGNRFPWGNNITCSDANYYTSGSYPYDVDAAGAGPCTTPNDTSAVGSYAANGYGLYDMAGNVWEWVADWYGPYSADTVNNPTGPASGSGGRVVRGGAHTDEAVLARVASRYYFNPTIWGDTLGFRCAR